MGVLANRTEVASDRILAERYLGRAMDRAHGSSLESLDRRLAGATAMSLATSGSADAEAVLQARLRPAHETSQDSSSLDAAVNYLATVVAGGVDGLRARGGKRRAAHAPDSVE